MCLSIPGKIISIDKSTAMIDISGNIYQAGTQLIDNINKGDIVLIHSGFIIQKLTPEEAEETEKLLREILESEDKLDNQQNISES